MNVNIYATNLFENLSLLKFPDKVILENGLHTPKYFNQALPKTFKNWFNPRFQQIHMHIIPGGLTQVVLKYLLIIENHLEDIKSK